MSIGSRFEQKPELAALEQGTTDFAGSASQAPRGLGALPRLQFCNSGILRACVRVGLARPEAFKRVGERARASGQGLPERHRGRHHHRLVCICVPPLLAV
jgi:hypothetical protein